MTKRRIKGLVFALLLVLFSATTVAADSAESWTAEHSSVDAYYCGRIAFTKRSINSNLITFYARILGSERDLITCYDCAHLKIDKKYRVLFWTFRDNDVDEVIFYGHDITTKQIGTNGYELKAYWDFDNQYESYTLN